VLTSDVIVVVGMSPGTAAEVSLALKNDRRTILLSQEPLTVNFFKSIGEYKVQHVSSVAEVIVLLKDYLAVNKKKY
jgi:SLOG cluster4 family